ncbi:Replication factor C, subunit RFC4 [Oleoguttula sp. CCFEE 5521]
MKILTPEEEQAHYNATLKGGIGGGLVGVLVGTGAVAAASQRYHFFRGLTLPFRTFLVVSTGTFAAIISADKYSRHYENSRHPESRYEDESKSLQDQLNSQKSTQERTVQWAEDNKYSIVFGSWVASMATALGIVGRSPYLTGQQKLVQARVYAQGLTMAVVIASLALEGSDSARGKGRWETVKILDPNDPTHKHVIEKKIHHERYAGEDQWRDMVEAEEERIKERETAVKHEREKEHKKTGKKPEAGKAEKKVDLEHGKKADEAKDKKINAP